MPEKVDYNSIYSNSSSGHFEWVKKTCLWKAQILSDLIKDMSFNSILEIGTGRGDMLNALDCFKKKTGADISEEALRQHHLIHPDHELVKIDADRELPFTDDQFDCVLLCDILEHVNCPVELLKEASRVGKCVLLKIPIEKALLNRVMQKIRGVKYGLNHPAGHLYCWNVKETLCLLSKAKINIIDGQFFPAPVELSEKRFGIKTLAFQICALLDRMCKSSFFSRILLGGSYFSIGRKD